MSKSLLYRLTRGGAVCVTLLLALGFAVSARAIEVLTVHELVLHCQALESEPEAVDGQYCIRYIQGFIDGAVETDDRIMSGLTSADASSGLTERAMRTRMPRRGSYDRPGSLAGFCLGDPLPLREVVDAVVTDLSELDVDETADLPARVAVEDSLRSNFPCAE